MNKRDLARRIHVAVSALSEMRRDDGFDITVSSIDFHGVDCIVDIVAGLGDDASCEWVSANDRRYRVAKAKLCGVSLVAYGNHSPEAAEETEPAPESREGS